MPNGSVKFFFADQEYPPVSAKLGNYSIHQHSSTQPPEDARSCNVAFLKALVTERIHPHGTRTVAVEVGVPVDSSRC